MSPAPEFPPHGRSSPRRTRHTHLATDIRSAEFLRCLSIFGQSIQRLQSAARALRDFLLSSQNAHIGFPPQLCLLQVVSLPYESPEECRPARILSRLSAHGILRQAGCTLRTPSPCRHDRRREMPGLDIAMKTESLPSPEEQVHANKEWKSFSIRVFLPGQLPLRLPARSFRIQLQKKQPFCRDSAGRLSRRREENRRCVCFPLRLSRSTDLSMSRE